MTGGGTRNVFATKPLQHSISNRLHGLAEFLVWVKLRFEIKARASQASDNQQEQETA